MRGRFAPDLFAVDAGRVLDVGTVLPGGFCVSGLLGRGSLADVYAVTAPSGQTLALKMLHEQMASDPSLLARFSMEADLLARISHPAVIGYRTRGAWGRRPFLVMERAAGHDLALELSRHAPLCATRVVGIGCGVLDGLIALHANGIVHRDIKPANVFVSAGETPRVQLIDLGSATRIGTEGRVAGFDQDRLTPFGHTMVTPHYASPELLTGVWSQDPRGDLYATGVLVFQMLTGELPFDHADLAELVRRIVSTAAPSVSVFGAPVDALSAWIERALHVDSKARFSSALAMRQALAACVTPVVSLGAAGNQEKSR